LKTWRAIKVKSAPHKFIANLDTYQTVDLKKGTILYFLIEEENPPIYLYTFITELQTNRNFTCMQEIKGDPKKIETFLKQAMATSFKAMSGRLKIDRLASGYRHLRIEGRRMRMRKRGSIEVLKDP